MISRVSSTVIQQIQNYVMAQSGWAGLLEYPPVDMSTYTEVRAPGYLRAGVEWEVKRDGLIVVKNALKFVGLDKPVVIQAIGLYPGQGSSSGLSCWGAFADPIPVTTGVVEIGAGTISFRIT